MTKEQLAEIMAIITEVAGDTPASEKKEERKPTMKLVARRRVSEQEIEVDFEMALATTKYAVTTTVHEDHGVRIDSVNGVCGCMLKKKAIKLFVLAVSEFVREQA